MSRARAATWALGALVACAGPATDGRTPESATLPGSERVDEASDPTALVGSGPGEPASGKTGASGGELAAGSLDSRADQSGQVGQAAGLPVEPRSPARAPRPPIDAASVLAQVRDLPAPRGPGSEGHVAAREHLLQRLTLAGAQVQVQPFTWAGLPDVELANLEAVLGGPTDQPGGPVLLVCAHYDTVAWSPGADDDGSGVAVVLEVARRLAGRDLPTEVRALLVDGEERGLVGSRHYVQSLSEDERSRLVGVINLESVGYADRRPGQQTMPAFTEALLDPGDVGDFVLVLANQASAELAAPVLAALASSARGDLRVVGYDRLAGEGWLVPDSRRSDHASFWDAGIPAVMLTDTAPFRNPHYHRPSDRVETLDGPFLAAVARGVERALLILAEDHSEAGP